MHFKKIMHTFITKNFAREILMSVYFVTNFEL